MKELDAKDALAPLVHLLDEAMLPFAEVLQYAGISPAEVYESLKRATVAAAKRRLAAEGVQPTKSRVALMCDLPRAEVARLYSVARHGYEPRLMRGTQVLDRWSSGKRWQGKNGPLDLPFKGIRSFCELCRSVTRRVRPNTILEEFEANGNIEILDNGLIRYINKQVVPREKLALIGAGLDNIRNHLETFLANVRQPNSLYEQFIASDGIPRSQVMPLLRELRSLLAKTNTKIGTALDEVEIEDMKFDTVGVGLYVCFKPLEEK